MPLRESDMLRTNCPFFLDRVAIRCSAYFPGILQVEMMEVKNVSKEIKGKN